MFKKIVLPSCRSIHVRLLLIFGTQMKIILMKSESFLTLHRQQCNYHVQGPFNDFVKIVHVTSGVQPWFYEATEKICVHKENKNNIIQRFLLFRVSLLWAFTTVPGCMHVVLLMQELPPFVKKKKKKKHSCEFLICVLKINHGLTGLERHECE